MRLAGNQSVPPGRSWARSAAIVSLRISARRRLEKGSQTNVLESVPWHELPVAGFGGLEHLDKPRLAFTPTNTVMDFPQYFDVPNWNQLFFRLQTSP